MRPEELQTLTDRETVIHPTADIHQSAEIGRGVEIGAGCMVGAHSKIGDGTRLRPRAIVLEHTILGAGNDVHPYAVLGGDPQDRKYDPASPGRVIIGDNNIIREHVTINRSVGEEHPTRLGDGCFLMCGSHIGHNAVVADSVTFANGVALAGHVHVGAGCFLSGGVMIHQFCTVGEMVMFQGHSAASMHVPPYVMTTGVNNIVGLNRVGLIRSGRFTAEERAELKRAYKLLYRRRDERTLSERLREADQTEWTSAAANFIQFIRDALDEAPPRKRGVVGPLRHTRADQLVLAQNGPLD